MARGEEWHSESFIGHYEMSETRRAYSSSRLRDNSAGDIKDKILNLPGVTAVKIELGQPRVSFDITVNQPQDWNNVEPELYDIITAALASQHI